MDTSQNTVEQTSISIDTQDEIDFSGTELIYLDKDVESSKDANVDRNKPTGVIRFPLTQIKDLEGPIFSRTTYIRNLPWRIMVQTSVKQKRVPAVKYLSIFLHCNNKTESNNWACYAHAEFRLLKTATSLQPYSKKLQHLFTSKKNYCGFYYFIPLDDVFNVQNGFIKNDIITMEAHVDAEDPWDRNDDPRLKDVGKSIEIFSHIEDGLIKHNKAQQYSSEVVKKSEETKKASLYGPENGQAIEEIFQVTESKLQELQRDATTKAVNTEERNINHKNGRAQFHSKFVGKAASLYDSDDEDCNIAEGERKVLKRLESDETLLEKQKDQLKSKLSKLEAAQKLGMKSKFTIMESKIANLERLLENEEKKRFAQHATNLKLERKVKNLTAQLDSERRRAEVNTKLWLDERLHLIEMIGKLERELQISKSSDKMLLGKFELSTDTIANDKIGNKKLQTDTLI